MGRVTADRIIKALQTTEYKRRELMNIRSATDAQLSQIAKNEMGIDELEWANGSQNTGVGIPIRDIEHDAFNRAWAQCATEYEGAIEIITTLDRHETALRGLFAVFATLHGIGNGQALQSYLLNAYAEIVATERIQERTLERFAPQVLTMPLYTRHVEAINKLAAYIEDKLKIADGGLVNPELSVFNDLLSIDELAVYLNDESIRSFSGFVRSLLDLGGRDNEGHTVLIGKLANQIKGELHYSWAETTKEVPKRLTSLPRDMNRDLALSSLRTSYGNFWDDTADDYSLEKFKAAMEYIKKTASRHK